MIDDYEETLRAAKAALVQHKKIKAELGRRRFNNFMLNGFWVVLVVLVLGGASYYGYTKRDVIISWVKTRVIDTFQKEIAAEDSSDTASSLSSDCENLTISVTQEDDGTHVSISPVAVGQCYIIGDADSASWTTLFSDNEKAQQYATKIFSESPGSVLTKEVIAARIQDSLSSNILDLR